MVASVVQAKGQEDKVGGNLPILRPRDAAPTAHKPLYRPNAKPSVLVPELPRNAMGKVQKNLLRAQYQALFG